MVFVSFRSIICVVRPRMTQRIFMGGWRRSPLMIIMCLLCHSSSCSVKVCNTGWMKIRTMWRSYIAVYVTCRYLFNPFLVFSINQMELQRPLFIMNPCHSNWIYTKLNFICRLVRGGQAWWFAHFLCTKGWVQKKRCSYMQIGARPTMKG